MDTKANALLLIQESSGEQEEILRALSEIGAEILTANDIHVAGESLKQKKFFCVVIDLEMKGGNAASLIRLIRTRADLKNVDTPIVILHSGLAKDVVQELFGKIQGSFARPVDLTALRAHIEKIAKFVKMSQ